MRQNHTILEVVRSTPPPSENYYFVYDENGNVLCDIDPKGNIKAQYIYANGKRIAKIDGNNTLYYHLDPLGSPLLITKNTILGPEVVKEYKYLAFGQRKYESGTYQDNHKFTGKELDGSGLYYFGARYYDKSLGRWLTTDPGLSGKIKNIRLKKPQSLNPYVYCMNNPLVFYDPNGEETYFVPGIHEQGYVVPFVKGLEEVGVQDVHAFPAFGRGTLKDYFDVFRERVGNIYSKPLEKTVKKAVSEGKIEKGEQLNLIGYSGGNQVVAETAVRLSRKGIKVDNVVLIGTKALFSGVTPRTLKNLKKEGINVIVKNPKGAKHSFMNVKKEREKLERELYEKDELR